MKNGATVLHATRHLGVIKSERTPANGVREIVDIRGAWGLFV